MIKFLSFILILINLSLSPAKALNEDFRFIVLGHLYPISSNQDIIDKLSLKIENYNPNIIFILGDSSIDDPKTKKMYEKKFKAKIFYVPGNQELKSNRNKYLQNVGYLNKTFIMNDLKFLLINSSDDIKNIKNYLIENLNQDFDQGKTFIMTHHRIWDDSIVDSKPFSHDKSYYFKEILPLISNKVSTIFAGNSKRQYFRDLSDHTGYGKHNTNLIYWYDKVGNINCYSIGMGDGKPKANFTIVDVINDKISISGDYVTLEKYDTLPRNLIPTDALKLSTKYSSGNYYIINKFKLNILLFFLIVLVIILLYRKKILK